MRRRILVGLTALVALSLVGGGAAAGADQQAQQAASADPNFRVIGDEIADSPAEIHVVHAQQHGGPGDHLPGSRKNVRLLGQVDIENVAPGDVADVAAWGNYAYLEQDAWKHQPMKRKITTTHKIHVYYPG